MTEEVPRHNVSPKNKQLAEEIVPIGFLIDDSVLQVEDSEKFFYMQAGNVMSLPKVKDFGDFAIDLQKLMNVLFSVESTQSLDEIADRYLAWFDFADDQIEDVKDALLGIMMHSQTGLPLKSVTEHPMSWRTFSVIPRGHICSSKQAIDHRVMMAAAANPGLSIWDLYDSLLEEHMTAQQTAEIQHMVSNSLVSLIRSGEVYISVAPRMYNQ